eukprot:gene1324-1670_t
MSLSSSSSNSNNKRRDKYIDGNDEENDTLLQSVNTSALEKVPKSRRGTIRPSLEDGDDDPFNNNKWIFMDKNKHKSLLFRNVIFYPSNSTDSSSSTSSHNQSSFNMSNFNFTYFFNFSTLDILLISYLNTIFWLVLIFTDGFLYHTVSYTVTIITWIYSVVKIAFTHQSMGKWQDPQVLPPNSPLFDSPSKREMILVTIALSIGLSLLMMLVNLLKMYTSFIEYRKQELRQKALNQEDSEKSRIKKNTVVKHSNVMRLIKVSKPELPIILAAMVALVISSLATVAMPSYFGTIVEGLTNKNMDALNNAVISLVIIFIVGSITTMIRAWLFYLAGQKFVARIRKELFASILKQEVAFFDASRTGELVNRLASDSQVIQSSVTVNISMAVRYIIQIIGCIILLFITSWKLTLVMLGVIPVLAIGAVFYGKKVKQLGKQFQDELAKSSTTGEEVISNIRTVKAFSKEQRFVDTYAKDINGSYLVGKSLALANGAFAGIVSLFAQLAIVLIVYVGAKQVISGTLSIGGLTSFLLYTLSVAMALAFVSSLFTDFMQAIGSSDRIFELMDRVPAIPIAGGNTLDSVVGEIELKNVFFKYQTRSDNVLHDINIKLSKSTVTALVGKSGGGKSTIVSLIERFYDPQQGLITLDGVDIKSLDPTWYRSMLGFVSQEPLLFAGTIKQNIAFGRENATMEEIMEAAEKANAKNFIETFEDKYETVVGERGVRLSGGQKQRIAIARALLLDPKVLLLDEATSALDAESEYLVKEAIDRLMHNRTVLVIAHRLSTVINANVVMVVNEGRIEEMGTHDELLKNENGIYFNLVKRQLS